MPTRPCPPPSRGRPAPRPSSVTLSSSRVAVAHQHLGARRAGVLERVGEPLLDDAVGREVDARRAAGAARPRRARSTGSPAARTCSTSASRPREARLRRRAGAPSSALAQHAEHAAQLAERRAAGAPAPPSAAGARARGRRRASPRRPRPGRPSRSGCGRRRRASRARCGRALRRPRPAPRSPARAPGGRRAPRARRCAARCAVDDEPDHPGEDRQRHRRSGGRSACPIRIDARMTTVTAASPTTAADDPPAAGAQGPEEPDGDHAGEEGRRRLGHRVVGQIIASAKTHSRVARAAPNGCMRRRARSGRAPGQR